MSVVVRFGQNLIMKEPCSIFSMNFGQQYLYQALNNANPSPSNNPMQPLNNSPNPQLNHLQIKPKWQNNQAINVESFKSITQKIEILNKILTSYFVDDSKDNGEVAVLDKLVEEIALQRQNEAYDKQEDFDSFCKLITLLASVDFKDYSTLARMTREQYEAMPPTTRAYLLQQIKQNKSDLIANLNLNMDSQPSSVSSSSLNKTFSTNYGSISGEFAKFRALINVPNVSDEHCKYYISQGYNDLNKAAEKYFQNSYTTNVLSLKFVYENNKESTHYFNFLAKPIEFHEKVRCDFPSLMSFKFYTMDNQEVSTTSSKIKCVGAFHFSNGTAIKVKEIK